MIIRHNHEKSVNPKLELTADGSHTLFIPELDEHYHSVNGAIQESRHVFIEAGLHHCKQGEIHVLEVGFGTGLNALLTLTESTRLKKKIHYTTVEAYPLPDSIIQSLNYTQGYSPQETSLFHKMHEAAWNEGTAISAGFYLTKIESDFTSFDFSSVSGAVDLIYFDAFAPDKQPEMWTQHIFDKLYEITAASGILTTYCAKGSVRRMLQQAGYTTERLLGPPGKREMLRATRQA